MATCAITNKFVEHLNEKHGNERYSYAAEAGRKYDKIWMYDPNQRGIHAFVERKTGHLLKAHDTKSPQRDKNGLAVRYRLADPDDMARAMRESTWHGSYLYKR